MTEAQESQATRDFVQANYRWNFVVNALDISFFTLALNMISQATILPLLVRSLTDSKIAIGAIPAIFSLGFLLPQLLTAGYFESLKRKKPTIVLFSGIGERLPYLLIGVFVLFFAQSRPGLTLAAIYLGVLFATGTGGALTPAWYDMISKVIPLQRRGIWSGVGNGLGAFMGIAGAALAGQLLSDLPYPSNFAACFLVSSGFQVISWVFLALNREPESETVKQHRGLRSYIRKLPALLRRDRNYQVFLVSRSVMNLGLMAAGFFIVYGSERFGLSGGQVGWLTAVMVGSQALMNLFWGLLGDRRGYKRVLAGSAFSMSLAALAALLVPSSAALWVIFILLGSATAADSVASFSIIVEFCSAEDRPTYIGLTNTLLAPARTLAPIIGGWLAAQFGYPLLFFIACALATLGGLLITFWLKEPRNVGGGTL